MTVKVPIRRVRFSTESFLSIFLNSLFAGKKSNYQTIIGGLVGKRAENMVYVSRALSVPKDSSANRTPTESQVNDLLSHMEEDPSGVDVVGWFASSMGLDISYNKEMRSFHQLWLNHYPDSFIILMNLSNLESNTEISDYLKIYTISGDHHHPSSLYEVRNVDVDLSLTDLSRALVKFLKPQSSEGIREIISESHATDGERDLVEKRDLIKMREPVKKKGTQRKVSKKIRKQPRPSERKSITDPLEEIERISREILKLKSYLAKLKREMDLQEHEDRTWFTKRVKFLKLRQIAIFDTINEQIGKTRDIQMRIAFYKVRESLSKDMKLLDNLINEQYMVTLTDLVKSGAETSDG